MATRNSGRMRTHIVLHTLECGALPSASSKLRGCGTLRWGPGVENGKRNLSRLGRFSCCRGRSFGGTRRIVVRRCLDQSLIDSEISTLADPSDRSAHYTAVRACYLQLGSRAGADTLYLWS